MHLHDTAFWSGGDEHVEKWFGEAGFRVGRSDSRVAMSQIIDFRTGKSIEYFLNYI
jgi:hypothetical protein